MSAADRRVFLGRDGSLIAGAVRWLLSELREDLDSVTIVVSGRRAARLLLEHIASGGPTSAFLAPRIVTPGALPELLYRPRLPVATALERTLAWGAVLKAQSPATLRTLFAAPMPGQEAVSFWRLAEDLESLRDELGVEGLRIADVEATADSVESFPTDRWRLLARMEASFEEELESRGRIDLNRARRDALERGSFRGGGSVLLVALLDLGGLAQRMLERSGRLTVVLVAAPESEREMFDSWGRPRVGSWSERPLSLARARVRIVDRPADQAGEVVAQLRRPSADGTADGNGSSMQRVTVGVGDASLQPRIERELDLAGLEWRSGSGRALSETAPFRVLESLGRFLRSGRFADFARLLRHPEVEELLADGPRHVELDLEHSRNPRMRRAVELGDWLSVLDLYTTQTLQRQLSEPPPGNALPGTVLPGDALGARVVTALHRQLLSALDLAPGTERRRESLTEGSERVGCFLRRLYEGRSFSRRRPGEELAAGALELLGEVLSEAFALDPGDPVTPRVTPSEVIELTLRRLAGATLAARGDGSQVEILGWLELLADDAPELIVTGMNEGSIPARAQNAGFLTETLRKILGLAGSERRFVRDKVVLEGLLQSRRLTLISGRRSTEDEPLVPSRLLLACAPSQLSRTVLEFYGDPEKRQRPLDSRCEGQRSRFRLVRPGAVERPIASLSVTAFRDYLACPYRFYLKHVLRLEESRDLPAEMSPAEFGALAHEILRRFAFLDEAAIADQERIFEVLNGLLERIFRERQGDQPLVAARIQVEQLRRRLERFAQWQADQVTEGWTLERRYIERTLTAPLVVGSSEVSLRGRIDRVERHPELGWRVLDYKTGERAGAPDRVHFKGRAETREWRDLQLPLYEHLLRAAGVSGELQLGFANLTQETNAEILSLAQWQASTVEEALDVARRVASDVLAERFWPPAEPPGFEDGFGGLAGDRFFERESMIAGAALD